MFYDEMENAIINLLNLPEKPDAIFVAGDRLFIGCLTVFKNLNIKIPTDMAITGFSNSDFLDLLNPPLTAVRQPAFEIGQIATDLLISLIESKYPVYDFESKILDTNLFVRD
ncbi:DNA-binding LacI/PurR family transcriptional regulator [Pedobacter sp. CG_S7]|uniref:substrate-binding domain-containing protein n=1 Tax=Pedobacter sp. CG_S7 TaxID=3143930 RepID=UPI003395C17F